MNWNYSDLIFKIYLFKEKLLAKSFESRWKFSEKQYDTYGFYVMIHLNSSVFSPAPSSLTIRSSGRKSWLPKYKWLDWESVAINSTAGPAKHVLNSDLFNTETFLHD